MKSFLVSLISLLSEPLLIIKGALIFLIGPLTMQLAYLAVAVGIDLMFGIQVARREKQFKWSSLFDKVRKKIYIYIMWIAMFHAFDMVAGLPNTARWAVVMMLTGLEAFSAIKNTARLGHSKLAEGLEQVYLSIIRPQPTNPPQNQAPNESSAETGSGNGTEKAEGGSTTDEEKTENQTE